MTIFDEFSEPKDLLAKAVREGRKALVLNDSTQEVCDHFFNFCITAHSIRDWCINYLAFPKNSFEAANFHNRCCKSEYLNFCRDIANSSKHMVLRTTTPSTVKSIEETIILTAALDLNGNKIANSEMYSRSLDVVLPNGESLSMFMVIASTIIHWQTIFSEYGIEIDHRCNSALICVE